MATLEGQVYSALKTAITTAMPTIAEVFSVPPSGAAHPIPCAWLWFAEANGNYGNADNNRRWGFKMGLRIVVTADHGTNIPEALGLVRQAMEDMLDDDPLSALVEPPRTSSWKYMYEQNENGSVCGVEGEIQFKLRVTRGSN